MSKFDTHKIYLKQAKAGREAANYGRRRKFVRIATPLLFVFSAAIYFFLLVSFANSSFVQISRIEVENANKDKIGDIQVAAANALMGKYAGLFSRANSLFFSRDRVVKSVMASSSFVANVKVARKGFDTLVLTVDEKKPGALICSEMPDFNTTDFSDNCYFADGEGTIFAAAPSFSSSVYNSYFIPDLFDRASTSPLIGSNVFATTTWLALQHFTNSVRKIGFTPEGVLIKDEGEYELYTRQSAKGDTEASSTETMVIYFNENNEIQNELSNLISFLDHEKSRKNLFFESIDLRYGSNVFFREGK